MVLGDTSVFDPDGNKEDVPWRRIYSKLKGAHIDVSGGVFERSFSDDSPNMVSRWQGCRNVLAAAAGRIGCKVSVLPSA